MPSVVKADEFLYNSFQAVVFCSLPQVTSGRSFGKLMSKLGERFDGAPTMLPLPTGIPPEVPRLVLQSADSQWGADFALSRVTFRWVQQKREDRMTPSSFRNGSVEFFESLNEIQSLDDTSRLAFLVNRYALTNEAASTISTLLLKGAVVSMLSTGVENCEVHLHQKVKVAGSEANEWIRFKSGTLTLPNTPPQSILLVEQDLNTLAEEAAGKQFSFDSFKTFSSGAISETETRFLKFLEV